MASSPSTRPAPAVADPPADDLGRAGSTSAEGRVEEVLAPISAEAPCGADATYDDDFQLVKSKIDALNSFSGRIDQEKALADDDESFVEEADDESPFAVIEATSRRLLCEKSKDLRIACYLSLALGHQHGLAGVAEGLALLRRLVETYWEDVHPPLRRLRARGGAFTFLFQHLGTLLEEGEPAAADRGFIEEALEDLNLLQAILMERMGDQAPLTSTFEKALEAALRRAPEPSEKEAAEASDGKEAEGERGDAPMSENGSTTSGRDGTSQSRSSGPEASRESSAAGADTAGPSVAAQDGEQPPAQHGEAVVENQEAAVADLSAHSSRQLNQRLLQAITVMRRQDDTQGAPYRLARALRWEPLQTLPPHDEDRQTRVAPPPKQRRAYLRGLLEKEDCQRLVSDGEDSFHEPPFHFWLDLQRWIAQGLDALGEPYAAAALAVRRECALLVERLPALPTLCFREGTPFARPATREWLATSVRPLLGRGAGDGAAGAEQQEADALEERFQEARRTLGDEGLVEALHLMNDEREAGTAGASQQERFRRRLYRARLCMRAGKQAVARPLLEALGEEADRRGLSTWDPPLALEVWGALYECLTALANGSAAERQEERPGAPRRGGAPDGAGSAMGLEVRAARAFDRICEINPERALSLRRKAASKNMK